MTTSDSKVGDTTGDRKKSFQARIPDLDGLPEAGASCNVVLYGTTRDAADNPVLVQFNLTFRGKNGVDVLDHTIAAIGYAREFYKLSTDRPGLPAGATPPAPGSPQGVQPAPAPVAIAPTAPANVPATAPGAKTPTGPVNVLIAVRLDVIPRTDGKVDLKFFEYAHNFPDLQTARTPEKCAELLSQVGTWTPAHFKVQASFPIRYRVEWTQSAKTNSNGRPYKDIVRVIPE